MEDKQHTLEEVLFGDKQLTSGDEEYLQYLTSCELNKLAREPDILSLELEKVEEEMKSTVVSDYKSFIQASQCIHNLHSSIENLSSSLKALTVSLTPLPKTCNNFSQKATPLKVDRCVIAIYFYQYLLNNIQFNSNQRKE